MTKIRPFIRTVKSTRSDEVFLAVNHILFFTRPEKGSRSCVQDLVIIDIEEVASQVIRWQGSYSLAYITFSLLLAQQILLELRAILVSCSICF